MTRKDQEHVVCAIEDPAIPGGLSVPLRRWGCRPVRPEEAAEIRPDALLADGRVSALAALDAVAALRRRLGEDLPALVLCAELDLSTVREAWRQGVGLRLWTGGALPPRGAMGEGPVWGRGPAAGPGGVGMWM